METSLKQRLVIFAKHLGISIRSFEARCNLSFGYIANLKSSPTVEKITKILAAFPELSRDWLLYGEGPMLRQEDSKSSVIYVPLSDEKLSGNDKMIPYYDAETTGGFNDHVSSSSEEAKMTGYINAGSWFNGKETAAIRHVGNSMTEYPDGCILVVRQVQHRSLLIPGRNYVIETDEYRITKRIQNGSSPDCITLYSTNQEKYEDGRLIHEPFEVRLEDVRRIFSILGYIVDQAGGAKLIRQ